MDQPAWFQQIKWRGRVHVDALNRDRKQIPDVTGCYAFTVGKVPIAPGRVLYVGEAAGQSLRDRLVSYLVDFRSGSQPKSKQHKGKGFVLEARHKSGDHGVFVSWVEYGASPSEIHILEASLIHYLNPGANDREEDARHPTLGHRDRLDSRLMR